MYILSYSPVLSPPAISSSRVCAAARSKEMQVAANVYQVVLHLHLSLKGIGIAVKLNIDKKINERAPMY